MKKRLLAIGFIAMIVISLGGCGGEEVNPQELADAENLVQSVALMGKMIDIAAYTEYSAPGSVLRAPAGWTGPDTFDVPAGENNLYYEYAIKLPFDSAGTIIDSLQWLLMLIPDVWTSQYADSTIRGFDNWFLAISHPDIWYHTIATVTDTNVAGEMKFNWDATWYAYACNMSRVAGDSSGEIDVTTSSNINLTAHFLLDERGAGSIEDNWAKYGDEKFAQFEFFAAPDADGYDGYYELLSENWEVEHYFTLD